MTPPPAPPSRRTVLKGLDQWWEATGTPDGERLRATSASRLSEPPPRREA